MSKAIAGHRYRHYKKETMLYTVVSADALDCESVKPLVVYRSEYENPDHPKGTLWVRDRNDFESKVLLPDGSTVDRFTEI
ncbi:DUF1653 domain-containing protein [Fibrobacter sp.]|uniref:DUF1653 domain-containing protein n=1 Tax=Fibrobacter sp. TaxID=35828 RepID=UPI002626A432|nr:DUF1653 domain-containing protein [Fibrobacter sp.]MDD5943805.1 DUF1653 domain-containing protein [Fibrobacter sp.]